MGATRLAAPSPSHFELDDLRVEAWETETIP
jgi:hypothetical protein